MPNLVRLKKQIDLEITCTKQGVWQARFHTGIEGFHLDEWIEAGQSHTTSAREIDEAVMSGLERWHRSPWGLEIPKAAERDLSG